MTATGSIFVSAVDTLNNDQMRLILSEQGFVESDSVDFVSMANLPAQGSFTSIFVHQSVGSDFHLRLLQLLKAGGSLFLLLDKEEKSDDVQFSLLTCGFVDIARHQHGYVVAKKPDYALGHAVPLMFKKKPAVASSYDDLIDEDALLDEEDRARPLPYTVACGPDSDGTAKKKKACKNCSCGLAEIEAAEEAAATDAAAPPSTKEMPKSSCGSVSQFYKVLLLYFLMATCVDTFFRSSGVQKDVTAISILPCLVLPWGCLPLRFLSVSWNACFQAWRESSVVK
jgi:hypothetical protein